MIKRVDQGLSGNSVDLILDLRWQLPRLACDRDVKVDIGLYLEFFLNARQRKNQI